MNIGILFSNIIGYDGIVFACAAVAAIMAWRAYVALKELNSLFAMNVIKDSRPRDTTMPTTDEIDRLWRQAVKAYTRFENTVSLFPTLGIGGTILGLCFMSGDLSNIQENFFLALTSTFWGLVGTFIFKIVEIFLSPMLEVNEIYVRHYIDLEAQPSYSDAMPKRLTNSRRVPTKMRDSDEERKPRNSANHIAPEDEPLRHESVAPVIDEPEFLPPDMTKPSDNGEEQDET